MKDQSYTVIHGPRGRSGPLKTAAEIRRLLKQNWQKAEAAHKAAVDAAIQAEADEGRKIVKERTEAGEDFQRRKFGDYSESYAAEKGVNPSAVDLKRSGKMLNSLRVEKTGYGIRTLRFAERYRGQVHGLATGKWKVFGKRWIQRPERRAMGFEAEADMKRIALKGWRAYQRTLRKNLKY